MIDRAKIICRWCVGNDCTKCDGSTTIEGVPCAHGHVHHRDEDFAPCERTLERIVQTSSRSKRMRDRVRFLRRTTYR